MNIVKSFLKNASYLEANTVFIARDTDCSINYETGMLTEAISLIYKVNIAQY